MQQLELVDRFFEQWCEYSQGLRRVAPVPHPALPEPVRKRLATMAHDWDYRLQYEHSLNGFDLSGLEIHMTNHQIEHDRSRVFEALSSAVDRDQAAPKAKPAKASEDINPQAVLLSLELDQIEVASLSLLVEKWTGTKPDLVDAVIGRIGGMAGRLTRKQLAAICNVSPATVSNSPKYQDLQELATRPQTERHSDPSSIAG